MRIDGIRWFIKTANEGSINRASSQLHTSHQNLGKVLSGIEGELGLKLINRDKTGLSLTDDGKYIYEKFVAIDKIYKDIERYAARQEQPSATQEKIRLFIASNSMPDILANCILETMESFPQAELTVVEGGTEQSLKSALADPTSLCNVVLASDYSNAKLQDEGFKILMERPLELKLILPVCMSDYVHGGKITLEELSEIPLVIYSASDINHYYLYEMLNGFEGLNVKHIVNNVVIFKKMFDTCRYATLLPLYEGMEQLMERYVDNNLLEGRSYMHVPVLSKRKKMEGRVVWCCSNKAHLSDAQKYFLSLI